MYFRLFRNLLEIFTTARNYLIDNKTYNMTFEEFVKRYSVTNDRYETFIDCEKIRFCCIDTRDKMKSVFVVFRSKQFKDNKDDLRFIHNIFNYETNGVGRFRRLIIIFDTSSSELSKVKNPTIKRLFFKKPGLLLAGYCRKKNGMRVVNPEHFLSKEIFSMYASMNNYNLIEHTQPHYGTNINNTTEKINCIRIISTEEEKDELFASIMPSYRKGRRKFLPMIKHYDPLVRAIGAYPGDIIELPRSSQTSGRINIYREIVK